MKGTVLVACAVVISVKSNVSFLCPWQLDFVQFPQLFQRNFQSVRAGAFAVKLLLWLRLTRLQPVAETLLLISRLKVRFLPRSPTFSMIYRENARTEALLTRY